MNSSEKQVFSKSVINLGLFLIVITYNSTVQNVKCTEVKWKDQEVSAFSTYLRYLGPVDFF